MSELKEYEVRTASGYVTTFQYNDADAKLRGLLGKDKNAEAAKASDKATAKKAAAAKKAAEKEAADKAAAEEAAKAGPVRANKQAPAPENK
ncbi:hypothetical protein ACTXOR_08685 [Arthrobacter rhombi]|uniref:hypothetical protein n=1 Tax=Arthrobacter rhombi TaxID=71253 RepID=UPI003FD68115